MFLEPDHIRRLVEEHGSPLLVLSRAELRRAYAHLREQLPRVDLYYAVKANPAAALLETLAGEGSGFDVASSGELELLDGLGVAPPRLIYTNPVKGFGETDRIAARGVETFFYDNEGELDKIASAAPGSRVMLRLGVVNPNCVVNLGEKFGCDPADAEALLDAALARGLTPRGLCFHVGSQTSIPQPYVDMVVFCRGVFNRMALRGTPLATLDIGGGFPVAYKQHVMDLESFCKPIRDALDMYFPDTEIMAEPGRVLAAGSVVLLARVIGRTRRRGTTWYYLEEGVYGAFSGTVFDHASYSMETLRGGTPEPCVVSGPTCDSFDVISREEVLPPLDVGDLIVAHGMGAYTNASATRFNGIPPARLVAID